MREAELTNAYQARRPLLVELASRLEEKAKDALDGVPHIDRISFRAKSLDSFLEKAMKATYANPLSDVEDQVGGRVLTFFRNDIPVVRASVTKWFGAIEHTIKEPAGPKEFGYESDHYIFVIAEHVKPSGWDELPDMPTTFELQIRTLFMHAWAEPQHNMGYKGSTLDDNTSKELAWAAASAWGADRTFNEVALRLGGAGS